MAAYSASTLIILNKSCKPNSVFLRWLTPNAGWDGWLFNGDKDEDVNEGENNHYRPAGARVDTVLSKTVNDAQTLRAGKLSYEQARSIKYIQSSPLVQMCNPDGSFQPVKVTSYNDKIINGAEKKQKVVLSIEVGTRNSQTN